MSETTHLIRRDLPLEQGRKLRFSFTVAFELTVDENLTGDDTPATLDDLEQWLGNGYSDQLYRALAQHYDRNVVEHEVTLDDRYEGADDGQVRFEHTWEARDRENGRSVMWSSRVWLDEIPIAGALPYGPESNPPIPAPIDGASLTAEEVMAREG